MTKTPLTADEIALLLGQLERLAADDRQALAALTPEQRRLLLQLADRLVNPSLAERRRLRRAFRSLDKARERAHDTALLTAAATRRARIVPELPLHRGAVPASEDRLIGAEHEVELQQPRACYICKAEYRRVHFFYHALCGACGDFNYGKRQQRAELDGKVALVTGGRIKIGYEIALILLRCGARVIVSSRFPVDAARRFAKEPDHAEWSRRLTIYGLDLRHLPSVERFADHLVATLPRLDIVIHNAAQTVRRPPHYYEHLVAAEDRAALPSAAAAMLGVLEPVGGAAGGEALALPSFVQSSAQLAVLPLLPEERQLDRALFPEGFYDPDGQQVDLRQHNSWRMTLGEVSTVELVEVHLVNAMSPFILTSRLRPLLVRHPGDWKHVVNVSAMEASFSRKKKTDKHPHTNMAKASLNMLTRTSAIDLVNDGIYMNSVDTGWVTDEDPLHHVERKQDVHDFHPPLDTIDGAARVLDPIFVGVNTGEHPWGHFWKDYRAVEW